MSMTAVAGLTARCLDRIQMDVPHCHLLAEEVASNVSGNGMKLGAVSPRWAGMDSGSASVKPWRTLRQILPPVAEQRPRSQR